MQNRFKLTALKSRVGTLNAQRVQTLTTDAQRVRGSTWMATRDRILRRDQGLCQCERCQAPGVFPLIAHEIDHRVPLWEPGGTNDDSNLQSLNRDCHKRKSAEEAKRRAGK